MFESTGRGVLDAPPSRGMTGTYFCSDAGAAAAGSAPAGAASTGCAFFIPSRAMSLDRRLMTSAGMVARPSRAAAPNGVAEGAALDVAASRGWRRCCRRRHRTRRRLHRRRRLHHAGDNFFADQFVLVGKPHAARGRGIGACGEFLAETKALQPRLLGRNRGQRDAAVMPRNVG